jgi:protein-S-isoprenylcysteine O-methyltransferase Ste14
MASKVLLVYANSLWLLLLIYWAIAAPSAKKIIRQEPTWAWLCQMTAFVAAMYLLVFPPLPIDWLNRAAFAETLPISLVAASLVTVGIAFVVWARVVLGRNWSSSSALKQDHELIRSGPYGWVRHPIYTGLSVAILGSALQHGEVRSFLAVAICAIGFWSRIRTEERLLTQQFQAEYLAYKDEVPPFIPSVRARRTISFL